MRHDWLQAGAEDIKKHKWYSDINFDDLMAKKVEPPIKPDIKGDDDTNNFEYELPLRASAQPPPMPACFLICMRIG